MDSELKEYFDRQFAENRQHLERHVDARSEETQRHLERHVDVRLAESRQQLEGRLAESRQQLEGHFDERLAESRQQLEGRFDERLEESRQQLEGRFDESRTQLARFRRDVETRFEHVDGQIRRAHVLVEDVRGLVEAVAEGVGAVREVQEKAGQELKGDIGEVRDLLTASYRYLDRRLKSVERL